MDLDHDACYRVFQARDARFDGRLFVGVRTTGIYCRPICPARTPKRSNVTYYTSAAAAQEAGFRPCLRCRPEMSPELLTLHDTSRLVTRALALIASGALDEGDVESLSSKLGIGERQLRRLFAKHVGASPNTVAQTRRVHLAKQLIHDTNLSMLDVALASGFGSLRRFNETFKQLFGRAPNSLRRARSDRAMPATAAVEIKLTYSPPFDWQQMLEFFAMRAISGVERVDGDTYARSARIGTQDIILLVRPDAKNALRVQLHLDDLSAVPGIIARLRRLFDLAADPQVIGEHLAQDPLLADLIAKRPGLRVPGAWDPFELAVRAILGQQITVVAAVQLASKIVRRFARPLPPALSKVVDGISHAFPEPALLAAADIASLGMPRARGLALNSMAQRFASNPQVLNGSESLEEAVMLLRALPGIGEWTAQYIAMRELREPDAFPAADVGLMRAIQNVTGRRPTANEMLRMAERWRPWRAYAATHLWASLKDDRASDVLLSAVSSNGANDVVAAA
jgi:AraC family transcriptional regulator, regulatory protein of adaptative response / DNA-3-methyladenine glycosylase II